MEVGVCLPYAEPGLDRARILGWVRCIEGGPFHAVSCGERITGPGIDMHTALAAAAAVTERIRIVPSLYILPMRDAVRTAKEIATLDVVAGGRVDVTVGVGGRDFDYQAVSAPFERRHPRMDAQVDQMRRVWQGKPVVEDADPVGPAPVQAGGPAIHAGVMGPKAMARAARWADGVYVWSANGERDEVATLLAMADEAWEKAGRNEPPRRVGGFWYSLSSDDAQRKLAAYVHDYVAFMGDDVARFMASAVHRSTPAAVAAGIDAMAEAGLDEMFLVPATAELAEVERAAEIVAANT